MDGILATNGDSTNLNTTGIPIPLSAGLHTVQIRVNNNGGSGQAQFFYSGPDSNYIDTIVPFGFLSNSLGTSGSLQVGNSSALGLGPVWLSNGVFQANSAVTLSNPVLVTGGPLPLALAGSNITIANSALLTGNATLSVNNTTQFNGDLAGPYGVTLTNQPVAAGSTTYNGSGGTLVFTAPVSYTGPTNISAGTLKLSSNGALTQTTAANAVQAVTVIKAASGTFSMSFNGQTTAAITYSTTPAITAENIQAALAALPAIGANNVSVNVSPTSTANSQLFYVTFQGTLASLPQPLMTIVAYGTTTAGQGDLTSSVNIALGTVSTTTVGGPAVTINTGGTLTLDNTGTNNGNRINDAAVVALNGGTLNYLGNNSATSSEYLGTVALTGGSSIIQTTAGTGAAASVVVTAGLVTPPFWSDGQLCGRERPGPGKRQQPAGHQCAGRSSADQRHHQGSDRHRRRHGDQQHVRLQPGHGYRNSGLAFPL